MYKIVLYLKSGQIIKFKCKEYKFTFDAASLDYIGYTILESTPKVSLVPSQIAAYTVR